jgi:hypothetical protein
MRARFLLMLAPAALLSAIGCGDSLPTRASTQDTGPPPPTSPGSTMTRGQLLSDPLTVLLAGMLPAEARDARGARAWGQLGEPASLDPGDSLVVAATLELILQAAEALPPDSAGGD